MKRLLLPTMLFLTAFASAAQVQETPRAFRIKVRHADPYFIKGMLEGQSLLSPELSTALNFMGLPGGAVNMIDKMFEGGTFIVNAADNSIWWIPTRR